MFASEFVKDGRGLILLSGVGGLLSKCNFFSRKRPCTAHIVTHLIPLVLFLCRAMNPAAVKLPGFHYADHRLEITSHHASYTNVEHQETSKARHAVLA